MLSRWDVWGEWREGEKGITGLMLVMLMVHMDVSENSGTPQIIHFTRAFPYKPSILGYPIFGNTHIGDIGYCTTQLWYLAGNLWICWLMVSIFLIFKPTWGNDSHFDDHIFQMEWTHQPVMLVEIKVKWSYILLYTAFSIRFSVYMYVHVHTNIYKFVLYTVPIGR